MVSDRISSEVEGGFVFTFTPKLFYLSVETIDGWRPWWLFNERHYRSQLRIGIENWGALWMEVLW
jgi:hypothetical protein